MSSKKSLSYIETATADKNKQKSELLQKNLRNVELDIENNKIEDLKRKIDTITRYQKPYISKMLNKVLLENLIKFLLVEFFKYQKLLLFNYQLNEEFL